jgi:putative transposase
MYLFAIMDWYSRKIIDWELSNTLDLSFCLDCLKRAITHSGIPEIMNTDQGSQFTSEQWISFLKDNGIIISMDGKGRWLDNVAIERFWRSIKYEDVYLKSYETARDLARGIKSYITRYNQYRPHQSLNEATPEEIYSGKMEIAV